MKRMNISIPDDLRDRMDLHPDINWSGLAQATFELEINSKTKGSDMDHVVERLRASKQKIEVGSKPTWIDHGFEFASDTAEFDELERIALIDPRKFEDDRSGWKLLKALATARLNEPADKADALMFFEDVTGRPEEEVSRLKVEWILEGMINVWHEVKDRI
jgi:hypothetical protein